MPGKRPDSKQNGSSLAVRSSFNGKPATAAESAIESDVDSARNSPQDWNRGERSESMRSGSGRSLASLGSKGDTNFIAESSASGGGVEVGKEAKEKKDKSSWVKTIGMRTLRLRKNKDPEKSQSRLSISSTLGSLDRPGKSKSKNKSENKGKHDDELKHASAIPGTSSSSSSNAAFTTNHHKTGEHAKDKDSIYSGILSKNGPLPRDVVGGIPANSAAAGENSDKQDPARFLGEGLLFKGKLIGVLEVSGPRGDRICQEALSELKMAVKAAGEHKQKITIHIALDGLRIRDEKTGDCLYHHQVHKISFIAQDLTDARAFGYIFGSPDTGHRFFGIKTEKSASQVVISMRDLFQCVFDLKKKEIERAKQQLEMQQKFLATRAAETAPTTKTEPKFSIAETYIEGAGAIGGIIDTSTGTTNPSAPAEVDLLNLEVELNSLQEGLDNIHTNLVDSVPFRGSTASISSNEPMPKLSTGSISNTTPTPHPTVGGGGGGDPFGDSFDPFDGGASTPTFSSSAHRYSFKTGINEPSSALSLGTSQQQQVVPYSSSTTTPLAFTADPFSQIDPFPGPKYHGDGEFFNSDPFDSPSGQFSFAYPNAETGKNKSVNVEKMAEDVIMESTLGSKFDSEKENSTSGITQASYKERYGDGWVASFEDNFVPESEGNGHPLEDLSKVEMDIFTDLDPLGTGRIRPFVDRKDFFHNLKHPPKRNLKDLGAAESLTPHSSSSSLVAESSLVNTGHAIGLNSNNLSNKSVELTPPQPPKLHLTDTSIIPNSFSTNFITPQFNEMGIVEPLPLKTPPTSASSRSSSIRMRLHSENSRSESPPNYSPPPPPHNIHFSSTSSIGSTGGVGAAANSEYMTTTAVGGGSQLPFLPPPSSVLGTPPSSRFANKKSPQLLKQMTIAGTTANTAISSSPQTLPRPSSSGRRERKLTAESQSSAGTDEIPNLTPPPRPPHTTNTLGKSVSLSTAVPRPSSGVDRLRNLSGLSSLSGNIPGVVPPEPPPRPLQTTTISSSFSHQLSPALVSPPPPLPPKKQNFSSMQSSPLNLFSNSSNVKTEVAKSGLQKLNSGNNESSNDLPLPLPSRKSQLSASNSHHHAAVGSRYSVPLSSVSPSVQRKEMEVEQTKTSSVNAGRKPPVVKLSMEQALKQVASMSLGDLAGKLELPVEKLSTLTIQQLAEKLTLMDFEQRMEQKEREISHYGSISQLQQQQREMSSASASNSRGKVNAKLGFEDDFSTASAPPDFGERNSHGHGHHHHNHHHGKKEEFDKYAVFRELSIEDASGFSIIASLGSNTNKPMSDFSGNSEDEDLSRTMDKTLTNKDSSSERTIQADGTGGRNTHTNKDESFATAMANTMDDITDANLSDDDGKFPFDDDDDNSPSSNFNQKPAEWATFDSHFDDRFATTSLVKAVDADDGNGSTCDSEDGGEISQKSPPVLLSSTVPAETIPISPCIKEVQQPPTSKDKFDFEPFQKPSQPTAIINYSLSETSNPPLVPPVPVRRKLSKENGGIQPSGGSQPLSPDLLRSPVSQFHRQSSGSSKHSGKSTEEPSVGGGRGSDYSESGGRSRHRRGSNSEDAIRWERERDTYDRRRRNSRSENFGRSDSRDSYSSLTRGKYRDGRGGGDSEEEYVPSKTTVGRRGRNSNVRPSSSKRSSEREGEPEDEREEEEDTRSYASYHSSYSTSGRRKHRRYPPKYHQQNYSSSHRRRERDRSDRPSAQAAGSGHSSLSPERYSHHESDFDDSYEEENGVPRKKDVYARERDYAERHYHRPRPSSGSGFHHQSGKRYSRDSPRHSDPYYRERDRYYRGERGRRKYDDEYDDGREYSEYSGEEEQYHGRHGGHRRRHRGREYRDREPPRHRHYYTNSPSWDSESGPEPPVGAAGEKSEKGHRPSSAKYGSEHGSSRYSPPPVGGGSSSSRPNSGKRESGGRQLYQSDQQQSSISGNGQHNKRSQSGSTSVSAKMKEYRFEDDFGGGSGGGEAAIGSNNKPSDPIDKLVEEVTDCKTEEPNIALALSSISHNNKRQHSPIKSETYTPIDSKLSQPQSPFEDNFVIPENGATNNEDKLQSETAFNECERNDAEDGSEVERTEDMTKPIAHKRNQQQIFFPTKFESEVDVEGEESKIDSSQIEPIGEERENTSSPEITYTPPASANSLRGNFSVYSTKRLESIRSEEEKSNEDSVSESALTNAGVATNANPNSNMKKSDSFNIFQPTAHDPFADDDFFS